MKIYLKVPYEKKDEVKAAGAKWDGERKSWYIFDDNPNYSQLSTYMVQPTTQQTSAAPAATSTPSVHPLDKVKNVKPPFEIDEDEEDFPDEDIQLEDPDVERLFKLIEDIPDKVGLDFSVDTDRKQEYALAMGGDVEGNTASFLNQYDAKVFMLWNMVNNQIYDNVPISTVPTGCTENTVFLAVKKTGFSSSDEVIEIGATDVHGNKLYKVYCKPDKNTKFSFDNMKATHITKDSLSNEEPITSSWGKLYAVLDKADKVYIYNKDLTLTVLKQSLVMHNGTEADIEMLKNISKKSVEAMYVLTKFFKESKISLKKAVERLGFEYNEGYNTLCDCYYTIVAINAVDMKNKELEKAKTQPSTPAPTVASTATEPITQATETAPATSSTKMHIEYLTNISELQDKIVEIVANGGEYVKHISNPGTGKILLIYK